MQYRDSFMAGPAPQRCKSNKVHHDSGCVLGLLNDCVFCGNKDKEKIFVRPVNPGSSERGRELQR